MVTTITPESIDSFLSTLTSAGRSSNTVKAYRSDLAPLADLMTPPISLDDFEKVCAEYLTKYRSTWSPRTTRRRMTTIRTFGKFLGSEDFLANYKAPPLPAPVPHPVKGLMSGVDAMIGECKRDSHRALVVLCGMLGLRISEARDVRPSHFEFKETDTGTQCWLKVKGKGERIRVVPVPNKAQLLLKSRVMECERLGDECLYIGSDRSARRLITRLGSRADLGKVASHDLRHTAGTVLVNLGNLRTAQEILGHTSPTQTATYSMVSSEQKYSAATAASTTDDD